MKFKDNLLGKYWEFKQQNDFDYTVETDSFGENEYFYDFNIGIYVMLEHLFGIMLSWHDDEILIKLEYCDEEYKFNNVEDTLDFLLDKDTSKLDRISVERKKEEDCWFVNYFIFNSEKGTVKEFMTSSYDFKDHENY